jgi:ArsR family transcriptional regulator
MDACHLGCCAPAGGDPISSDSADDLAAGFKALGDPHRVAMVDLLIRAGEPVCVVDIERHMPLAQSTVSYHLKALVAAGVFSRERRGRWSYYTVRPDRLAQLAEVLDGYASTLATLA